MTPESLSTHRATRSPLWSRSDGTDERAEAAGYDAAGPQLLGLQVPTMNTPGSPLTFSVTPLDVWSPVVTVWNFGDGASASGATVTHTYAVDGTFIATVTSTDAVGNSSSATGTVADLTSPSVTGFSIARRFRVGSKPTAKVVQRRKRVKRGSAFRYRLSEIATVTITIERARRGRRVGGSGAQAEAQAQEQEALHPLQARGHAHAQQPEGGQQQDEIQWPDREARAATRPLPRHDPGGGCRGQPLHGQAQELQDIVR